MPHTRMQKRLEAEAAPAPRLKLGHALRECLKEGYGWKDYRHDLLAGIDVGIVALPLSMAFAIASGIKPEHGLYTAIIAGAIIGILGGSRVLVSGPTAAFVVILVPITHQYGLGGLMTASVLAGVMLCAMGLFRMGRLIEFVPYPVTTGFTAGIATVIALLQIPSFLNLSLPKDMPDGTLEKAGVIWDTLPTWKPHDAAIGTFTLLLLLVWPKISKRIPAALLAVTVAALAAHLLSKLIPGFSVETIQSKFNGIPQELPSFMLPWNNPGATGAPLGLSWHLVKELVPAAFTIAVLGAISSLLAAVVADAMTGQRHDPDAELFAQGVGNIVAPFFGGFTATGAIARSAAGIRAGARSPFTALTHSAFVLLAVLVLAPLLGYLPMASLAALLFTVAWNMCEFKHALHVLKVAPQSDSVVLLTCIGLTAVFDMVIAVSVGVVLAALLFMRRMAEVSGVRLIGADHPALKDPLPPGVLMYEIAGPLFFGAAQKAMSELRLLDGGGVKIVLLDLRSVPAMDATGLVNLDSAVERLQGRKIFVIIGGLQVQPASVLEKAGWNDEEGKLALRRSFEDALALARKSATSN